MRFATGTAEAVLTQVRIAQPSKLGSEVPLQVEYLEADQITPSGISLRRGEAGMAWLGRKGQLESEVRIDLSPNSAHALIGHGVLDALNALPIHGQLGSGLQVLIPPSVLDDARSIFYHADTRTYGAQYEFVVDRRETVEYRIQIDNREYQRSLSRLQYLLSMASREGRMVWIAI